MSTLKSLIAKESILRSRLEKLIENGQKIPLSRKTQGYFETRVADLKKLWEEYGAVDMSINELILETPREKTYGYSEEYYSQVELRYSEYMSELLEGLRKCVQVTESTPIQMPVPIKQESLLPRIALPKYNGDYDTWRSFHDLFVSLVHDNPALTAVQKLHHLKACLIGDAEKLLRHTPITNQDYLPAWNKLKERYENKRILVNHQLKTLCNQPKLNTETIKGIKSLIDTTQECLQQLKCLQVDTSSWDVLLIHLLVQSLPFVTLKMWEERQGVSQDLPRLNEFIGFLNLRLKVLESLADALVTKTNQVKKENKQTTMTHHVIREDKCFICQKAHAVYKCPTYQAMDIETRKKTMKTLGRCFNCLIKGHFTRECTNKYKCFKCGQKHHISLHENVVKGQQGLGAHPKGGTNKGNTIQQVVNQKGSMDPAREVRTIQTFVSKENAQVLLATVLVIAQGNQGKTVKLRCLVDSGSQSSFITETACKELGAIRRPISTMVTGLNTSPAAIARQKTTITIRSRFSDARKIQEDFLILGKITDLLPARVVTKRDCYHLSKLPLADPTFWKPGQIDALLGARVYAKIIQEGIRRGSKNAPVAINTMFGWIVLGSTSQEGANKASFTATTAETELNTILKQFWETEEVSVKSILTEEDEQCEALYETSYERLKDGTYQVKLPFRKNERPILGESRRQASQRFINLEKRLTKNKELEAEYSKCLNEYIELGHMEEVEPPKEQDVNYYIPHHAVLKDSTTTKLRVVFDASAKSANGNSLNDCLLKGPTLQPKLFATLLKWRKYKIAMNADIEKMYRMIKVHPQDRTFQRIIWKHPKTNQMQDYQLNTLTFGTASAPYLAIRTLQQLGNDERKKWPLASKAIYKDFYVDDLLTGADTITEAITLQKQLIEMLKAGGFTLRKWASNEARLLEKIPIDHRELKGALTLNDKDTIKTLGIRWHPAEDYFTFIATPTRRHTTCTKRTILSEIASLYDPLGWLAPIIMVAKILMQALWISGCLWDQQVSQAVESEWENFKADLHKLEWLKIPRWVHYSMKARVQLHGFCDASTKAYAAVLYVRVEDGTGKITCSLLTAKTKIAPTKPITIPRLELCGALLLARLIKTTMESMELQETPVYAWTDSTIVLQWIKEHPSRWKTYVANRVVEIQDILKYDHWRYIPTKENPADIASRGSSASNLIQNEAWWHGPSWLVENQREWPRIHDHDSQTDLEAKQPASTSLIAKVDISLLCQYSSYTKLVRMIATIQRFVYNCRNSHAKRLNYLSTLEWNNAERTIWKLVQQMAFTEERKCLIQNRPLPRSSKLLTLNPFIDENGLLRLGGRLANAAISYDRKHPIIIPRDHHVTEILIDKTHLDTLHGGTALVLNTIRDRYWILDARRCITSRIHKCVTCARHRSDVSSQLMGNLPAPRVNITKPFTNVGIDYAGPIMLKTSKIRNAKIHKAYICIFVCLSTKAIHIELVSDLTAEAFIAALKRFIGRRGLCAHIYSDCGTNFIGGKTLLDKEFQQAVKHSTGAAAEYLVGRAITWHFNPPAAPHFGGLWEAGVKSIKYHLRRTLGKAMYTFEEYATILVQIEACLNSRPLCYIRNDPEELLILTPGHFLVGQTLNALPESDHRTENILPSQRWKLVQERVKQFWDKWFKDYLNQLQNRPKWQRKLPNIQIGNVVLIKNEAVPPTKWPLGIVENTYPGSDGLVRVVQVRTQCGSIKRPITRVCKLPVNFEGTNEN